jgi:hypothetical protein
MDRKGLTILLLAALVLFLLFSPQSSRFMSFPSFGLGLGLGKSSGGDVTGAQPVSDSAAEIGSSGPSMGDVSAASLIPREVVQSEDFGNFSPANILSGQNYLDPRSQIGYPESLGGALRNANLQYRSEPINPRTPVSIFNLSTISPDTMRPKFEIEPEYQ